MTKRAASRNAFRGLFALYAAKAHHDGNGIAEEQLLRLFGSSEDIPDDLLEKWSTSAGLIGSEAVGNILSPLAHQIADGSAQYDHASDFLHRLLRELDRSVH
ncbi:hypothetical protein XI06_07030 [Bradyrhizobium sp. CCBAU 11434]|uniref:hypothetical protein n=1 Tax=Bradyrhizobium sp. CCBAU 11434 TaxID=1630885 RepID=UPI002305F2D7|nr:hypothetical protein [Bradyrhizobium sp. CCBAU 11434]MDA9520120.1 hypothetical protein [Bradyrhizobium sp. CCBAU 11434]